MQTLTCKIGRKSSIDGREHVVEYTMPDLPEASEMPAIDGITQAAALEALKYGLKLKLSAKAKQLATDDDGKKLLKSADKPLNSAEMKEQMLKIQEWLVGHPECTKDEYLEACKTIEQDIKDERED